MIVANTTIISAVSQPDSASGPALIGGLIAIVVVAAAIFVVGSLCSCAGGRRGALPN